MHHRLRRYAGQREHSGQCLLLGRGELRIIGISDSTPTQVERAVALIARGALPLDKIVTHVLKLDDILRAYALMESGESLRVVLAP